jgi:hypothetical protein
MRADSAAVRRRKERHMVDTTTASVEKLTTTDLLDAMYGSIQELIERGKPENVAFRYFLPPIPFGPELAAFMDIGMRPKELDNEDEEGGVRYTVNDMMRSAVNFASMVDYIPTLGENVTSVAAEENGVPTVDLNALISSGRSISKIYDAVLQNCKVIDNSPTEEEKARLEKARSVLFKEPKAPAEGEDPEALLPDDEEDIDLDALLGNGVDAADFVESPDKLAEPTKLMQLYRALQNRYEQVKLSQLEKLETISPNDPNAGEKVHLIQQRIRAAERDWEVQGKKTQVEAVMALVEQLSRAGMPQYVDDLRARMEANQLRASLFASEEGGVSLLTENAYYTALRPNGILNAPSMMKITLDSSNAERIMSAKDRATTGRAAGVLSVIPLVGHASGKRISSEREREFFSKGFHIEYEIVQGIIDRSWLDLAFLESPAYTTVDLSTKDRLDPVNDIVTLSDGGNPPKGMMPLVPTTVYLVRNLKVTSSVFKSMSQSERDEFSGKAGVSFLGFGASGAHTSKTTRSNWSRAQTSGSIEMEGNFVVGYASRFLKKAPNPDFEGHPNAEDWV